jgi:uncharacterized protein YbcI
MPESSQPSVPEDLSGTLGQELLAIHRDSYGRGAGNVSAHVCNNALVVFIDDLEFHPSEQFLIDQGQGDTVVRTREAYEVAIEATFCAAVERALGRRVESFISATRLEPPFSVEIFRLSPH